MNLHMVRLEFLVDTDRYSVSDVVEAVRRYIYSTDYTVGMTKDIYCGEMDMSEAVSSWDVYPGELEEED